MRKEPCKNLKVFLQYSFNEKWAWPFHAFLGSPFCLRKFMKLVWIIAYSQESEGSCKPARIKEVHSKLHTFQALLCSCTLIATQAAKNNYPYNPKFVGNTGNRTRDFWLDKYILIYQTSSFPT